MDKERLVAGAIVVDIILLGDLTLQKRTFHKCALFNVRFRLNHSSIAESEVILDNLLIVSVKIKNKI